jgi:hypothetical protein
MHAGVVVVFQRLTLGANHMHLVVPRDNDRVIATPLHRSWQHDASHTGIVFTKFILEIGLDDP